MNEQAQAVLIELLKKAASGVDSAVAFSQAQIPDAIHQLLVWNLMESLLFSVLGLLLFFVFQLASWQLFKYFRREWAGDNWIMHPEIMPLMICYGLTFTPLAWCSLDWLKIWLAPKLYLIEYAASLVGK
ncbi:hypothetical protein TUM12370_24500 [Salmonella enterica subsp. enterica serovar Choleraesuis]|nr:hypothetical protein TUM12370_24500 [Salmonella enterica subsp. enterica serovar Choleraesuis]